METTVATEVDQYVNKIIQIDCVEFMKSLPDNSVDHTMGRKFIGNDISEEYCKVATQRLQQKPLFV